MLDPCHPHTVWFPERQAIGKYTLVDCRYQLDWLVYLEPWVKATAPRYLEPTAGEARGYVVVPSGMGLYLWFPELIASSLEALTVLRPTDVQFLDLQHHGRLDESLLTPIGHLTGLLKMDLDGTWIGDGSFGFLRPLTKLRILQLTQTGIGDTGLLSLREMDELQVLQLGWSETTGEGLTQLGALSNLKVLNLANSKVTDRGLPALRSFLDLRVLDLRLTHVTDEGLDTVGKLRNLQVLILERTDISDAGLPSLVRLQQLVYLDLSHTRVTEVGYRWIQKQIPTCSIFSKSFRASLP